MNLSDKYEKSPSNMTFGLELEFTGGLTAEETQFFIDEIIKYKVIRKGWSVHFDRSVIDDKGYGAEIVSPPLTRSIETITNEQRRRVA